MNKITLSTTTNNVADAAQIEHIIQQVCQKGYTAVFSPHPGGWRANNHLHYYSTNVGEYAWTNSRGKQVVLFLLSGFNCKGYCLSEFEAPS